MGLFLTSPTSSAAIWISIGANQNNSKSFQISSAAACCGGAAHMIGFAVSSFRENSWSGLISQGLGTSMLQIPNIMKRPIILIPQIVSSIIVAVVCVALDMRCNIEGGGMGTAGLVGLFGIIDASENEIKVCPIPGANAALSALICSALDTSKFTFVGFLPKTSKNRRELLIELETRCETLIFYESPHHLKKTLADMLDVLGNRNCVLARELTKIHEEFLRGKLSDLTENLSEPIGEFVIVVEGKKNSDEIKIPAENFIDVYKNLIFQGVDKKSAIREVAKKFNLSHREVYNAVISS